VRAALAAVLLAPFVPAQEGAQASPMLDAAIAAHLQCVANERAEIALAEYAAADLDAKGRFERTLERLRAPGAGAISAPGVDVIALARRSIARAEVPVDLERLERMVDSLDLLPAPGILDASELGATGDAEPERLSVAVRPIYPITDRVGVELSLRWIGPSGEELAAGGRSYSVLDQQQPGVDLAVDAPRGAAGVWRLVPEVARGELRARGFPVAVERIARGAERIRSAVNETGSLGTPRGWLAHSLALRAQRGLRTLVGVLPSHELRQLEGDLGELDLALLEPAFSDAHEQSHWIWRSREVPSPSTALILLAPAHAAPEAALLRAEWKRFAREVGAELYSIELSGDPNVTAKLVPTLQRLRAPSSALRTIVVARGDAVASLQWGLEGCEEYPFDGLVLCTTFEPSSPERFLDRVPRLLVAPGGNAEMPSESDRFTWVSGSTSLLVAEARLPGLIQRWLSSCDAVRPRKR
jgi:hypothetical protein